MFYGAHKNIPFIIRERDPVPFGDLVLGSLEGMGKDKSARADTGKNSRFFQYFLVLRSNADLDPFFF